MKKILLISVLFFITINSFSQKGITKGDTIKVELNTNYYNLYFEYFNFYKNGTAIKQLNDSINDFFNLYKKEFISEIDEDIKAEMNEDDFAGIFHTSVVTNNNILKNGIISVFIEISYYTLGAHGNIAYYSFNYDTNNNKFINLADIANINKQSDLDEFNLLLNKYFENLDNCFDTKPNIKTKDYNIFYINDDYLTVVFPPYVFGSYACGTAEVKIPLKELKK